MRETLDDTEPVDILDEIIKLSSSYRDRRPDAEVTAREYAIAKRVSRKRAVRALDDLVEQGELATELVLNDGTVTRVWWPVDS